MRNFLARIGEKLRAFMIGRYGQDLLGIIVIGLAFILEIVFTFTRLWPFAVAAVLLLGWEIFRMLSRNIPARQKENRKLQSLISRIKTLKTHHVYKCSQCGQKIRVPRKGGVKVEITCPKCKNRFVKKI